MGTQTRLGPAGALRCCPSMAWLGLTGRSRGVRGAGSPDFGGNRSRSAVGPTLGPAALQVDPRTSRDAPSGRDACCVGGAREFGGAWRLAYVVWRVARGAWRVARGAWRVARRGRAGNVRRRCPTPRTWQLFVVYFSAHCQWLRITWRRFVELRESA